MREYASWGNYPPAAARRVERPLTAQAVAAALRTASPLLPYGNGRSQGDSCLNDAGGLLDMRGLNHFLSFDDQAGILCCEAGVLLSDILTLIVPRGWFLPVTPGTKYVTVGGAIANDVHGKNHRAAGTFGHHVRRFALVRSTGESLVCSEQENQDLFRATIGGLGLTGVITWAEIALRPITTQAMTQSIIPTATIADLLAQAAGAAAEFEYQVAWVDCLARGKSAGRGVLSVGNHAVGKKDEPVGAVAAKHGQARVTYPVNGPAWLMNRHSVRVFNWLWRHRQSAPAANRRVHFNRFFYPLDAVAHWNRLYGRRGFFQYQCVVPLANAAAGLEELMSRIAHSQLASFLSTVKFFGDKQPAGMLSFPRPGVALAVDFANQGPATLDLFNDLDAVVRQAGGALYPAKDSRMSPAMFALSFPRLPEFKKYADPALSSSFWRRMQA